MEKVESAFLYLLRFALAGFFIYAGASKLLYPEVFYEEIEAYRLIPNKIVFITAYFLPSLEICAGIALLITRTSRAAALIILSLNMVFIAAISSAWVRGLDINCGCFGGDNGVVADYSVYYLKAIVRDLAFALMAFLICLGNTHSQKAASPR